MSLLSLSPDLPQVLLATVAVRATVILAAAWLLTRALRRGAASTRHAVWGVALASLLLLPLVSLVLPRWDMPAPSAPSSSMMAAGELSVELPAAAPAPSAAGHDHGVVTAPPASPPFRGSLMPAVVLLIVWALGAAFGLGRLSAGWAAARRLVRRAVPLATGHAAQSVRELASRLGIRRDVGVRTSATLTVPVNCGLLRPVILLPASAHSWSDERLRVVLLHELAHVRRWDYASLLVTEAVRALYWFNPLVWIAAHRANVELERACDDEVLRAGTRSVEYAEHLYEIAASLAGARAPSGALAMAQPSTLRARVGAILAATGNRSPLRLRALLGAAALALLVGLPLASLRLLGEGRDAAVERSAIRRLSMGTATERVSAAWTLGSRKASGALAPLSARLRDPDPTVRGIAAWALGHIGDRDATRALVGALGDSDRTVREMAVMALGTLGDRRAVAALAPLAQDPEMGVRGVLTGALRELGGGEAGAVLAAMVLHDADTHVRDMATWNLRMTMGADAVPTLIQALGDPEPMVRGASARNLYELADARGFEALRTAATADPAPMVRGAASYALGALRDARAAEPLALVLRDSVWNVRVAAAGALAHTPGQRATDALIAATRDPVHQVRLTAVDALTERQQ